MSDEASLPLEYVPSPTRLDWCQFQRPEDFLKLIPDLFRVNAEGIYQTMPAIASDVTPGNEHLDKIWVKTSEPPGIGIPSGGKFNVIYQYPVSVPFIADFGNSNIPIGVTELSPEDIASKGLTPINKDATNPAKWYIFQPPTV